MNQSSADLKNADWALLTHEEKKRLHFLRQKKMLDMFLEREQSHRLSMIKAFMTWLRKWA